MLPWNRLGLAWRTCALHIKSTVPFVENCCSGIIKYDRARTLIKWLLEYFGVRCMKTLFIVVVIFFATFNAHTLVSCRPIIYDSKLEIFCYLMLQLAHSSHTLTHIHCHFHEFRTNAREWEWKKTHRIINNYYYPSLFYFRCPGVLPNNTLVRKSIIIEVLRLRHTILLIIRGKAL